MFSSERDSTGKQRSDHCYSYNQCLFINITPCLSSLCCVAEDNHGGGIGIFRLFNISVMNQPKTTTRSSPQLLPLHHSTDLVQTSWIYSTRENDRAHCCCCAPQKRASSDRPRQPRSPRGGCRMNTTCNAHQLIVYTEASQATSRGTAGLSSAQRHCHR